jgi:hypothetical protein
MKNKIKLNVFQVTEADCYMGRTLESAIRAAMRDTGLNRESLLDDHVPYELSDEQLDTRRFFDEENNEERTFRAELQTWIDARQNAARIFSTTEF